MDSNYKRRALGKGLEELFNNEQLDFDSLEKKIIESVDKEEIVEIELSQIRSNPYQPRKFFDEEKLQELADSISEHGVIQPIIVKMSSVKGYEIVAGERRVKASLLAGKDVIPAIIRNFSDKEMMEIALLENLQRENLNAIEEALAYKNLLNNLSITQEELAKRLSKSRSHVTNMIGLLTLPEEVKDLIIENKISMSHARVLSKMENREEIIVLANKIVEENLNVRNIEDVAKEKKPNKSSNRSRFSEYDYVENLLCEKLGTKVRIKENKVVISFSNKNDLNRILEIININE